MQNNFKTKLDVLLNQLFVEKEEDKKLSIALSVVNEIISFMGLETKQIEDEILFSRLPLPNSERFDTWFKDHPRHRGYTACFNLFKNDLLEIQFYNQKKKSKLFIAGAVNFFPNFEDRESFISDRVGIDIFLTPNNKSILIVLSNKYKLRVLELHRKLSNTQVEIFKKWENISTLNDKKQLHTTLWDSLQLKEVNKNFYIGLSNIFLDLTQDIKSEIKDNFLEKDILENTANQFGIKFLTRLIFIWFLKVKGFVSEENEYFDISKIGDDNLYYKNHLSKLFFEVLNVEIKDRNIKDTFTPYLNGGLFDRNNDGYWADKNPTFPKGFFKVLFDHLNEYNFTTDESTPEYEQIAIDPEMLGKIFENLLASLKSDTGAQARKAKGSFYTPREIVSYMVKESLREYLFTSTNADDSEKDYINNLLDKNDNEWAIALSNNKNIVNKKDVISKIINSLDNLKLLDPACGSGAYPIGVLQKMLSIYERLDSRFDILKVKTEIIKNNIYGVDIDPIAIDICRLRVFLSLTIEQNMNFKKDNNGISTLPNLDFKFVCANTLIGLEEIKKEKFDLDVLEYIIKNYHQPNNKKIKKELQNLYFQFLGYKNEKEFLEYNDKNNNTLEINDKQIDEAYEKIIKRNPFNQNESADFYSSKLMHGVEGFDIVIGNPPYVSVKSITKENKKTFPFFLETAKGRFNLFTLFLEKGQKLLKVNGIMSYILPEVLYSNSEYRHIRKYLLNKTQILIISNFSKKVFEAAVDTSVIIIKNNIKNDSNISIFKDLYLQINIIKQSELDDIIPTKNDNNISLIIKKIYNDKEKLSNIIKVQQGIIYSGQKKEEVFSNSKIDDNFKKVLDGRDIHKYFIDYDSKTENRYIKYTKKLHRPRDERLFLAKEKLIFPRRSTSFIASIDKDQFYLLNTSYICLLINQHYSLKYILAILNSKLINFLYPKIYNGWQITIPAINQLPIPKTNIKENKKSINKIESLVQNILDQKSKDKDTNTKDLEKEIDTLVYELYGLTEEEREVIENGK